MKYQLGRTAKVIEYIRKEWYLKKEQIVTAWTSKYQHFGTLVTLR
jgi:hypothetical protein